MAAAAETEETGSTPSLTPLTPPHLRLYVMTTSLPLPPSLFPSFVFLSNSVSFIVLTVAARLHNQITHYTTKHEVTFKKR